MNTTDNNSIKEFNFEVYTSNPLTGETGWDIKFASTFATDKEAAKDLFRSSYPTFDCFITFNFGGCDLGIEEMNLYNDGVLFFDRHSYMNNDIVKTYYRHC